MQIWDIEARTNLVGLELDGVTLQPVDWTPDGGHVVVAAPEKVFAWNVEESKLEQYPVAWSRAVSPNGRVVAQNESEDHVTIRDLRGITLANLILDGTQHEGVRFSPNEDVVATLAGGIEGPHEIVVWDLSGQQPRCRFPVRADSRRFFEFSHDGRRFAAGSIDETVLRVRDTTDGRLIGIYDAGTNDIWGIALSPDGRLLAAGTEGTEQQNCGMVRVWDVASGRLLTEIVEKECWGVTAVAFSRDGQTLAAGNSNGELKFFDTSDGSPSSE